MQSHTPTRNRPVSSYERSDVSPGRQKIQLLSEKLNAMDLDDGSKNTNRDAMDLRLKRMDEKLRNFKANDETTFRLFKEPLLKLTEALSSQKNAREGLEEKKEKELKSLDTDLN